MAITYTQANRPIKVSTPLADDLLLLEKFSGVEAISEPFSYQLDLLAAASETVAFDAILGKSVTVTMMLPDKSSRYINGIVAFFNESGVDAEGENIFNHFRPRSSPRSGP